MKNQQIILISRPSGVARAENFAIKETSLEPLEAGQIRVRNEYLVGAQVVRNGHALWRRLCAQSARLHEAGRHV
jgi:NADPH-dependent curcumin reductase CurA